MAPIFRAALVAVVALLAVGAQAERRALMDLGPCPGTPLAACDFFFAGSMDTLPTYAFKGIDKPLSTPVFSSKNPRMHVTVSSSGTTQFFDPVPAGASKVPKILFYLTGSPGSTLRARANFTAFSGNCMFVPIESAQLSHKSKGFNLNPNVRSKQYPVERRCVVFKV